MVDGGLGYIGVFGDDCDHVAVVLFDYCVHEGVYVEEDVFYVYVEYLVLVFFGNLVDSCVGIDVGVVD